MQEVRGDRVVPGLLDVTPKSVEVEQVTRSIPEDLIGNVGIADGGVPRLGTRWSHKSPSR